MTREEDVLTKAKENGKTCIWQNSGETFLLKKYEVPKSERVI